MRGSRNIVLGIGLAEASEAAAPMRVPTGRHWRDWRRGGVAISAAFHGAIVAAALPAVPARGGQEAARPPLHVEIVPALPKPPPLKPAPAKPARKMDPPLPLPKPERHEPAPALGEKIPPPPPPAPKPPADAEKPLGKPADAPAAALRTPEPAAGTARRLPMPMRPPRLALMRDRPPDLGPPPGTPRPAPRQVPKLAPATKVAVSDGLPDKPGRYGHWELEPVLVNLDNRHCGEARLSGSLDLRERIGAGLYRGVIETRIVWAQCPPEGTRRHLEMRVANGEVSLIGDDGFVDHGVIGKGLMLLKDAYGESIWIKR
jgi:hypothetical protein